MLTIGMPAGSLADPKRGGNLIQLLHTAGFYTKGYDAGGPSSFSTVSTYLGWDGRPQEFGSQLGMNEIDVAIGGDDWIKERVLEFKYEYGREITLEKVMSLQRGGVRIVGIIDGQAETDDIARHVKNLSAAKDLVSVVSEMPYLAMDWLKGVIKKAGLDSSWDTFSVQKYKSPAKISKGFVIYETWGKTEAKVKNGGADLGLEITQSGSALRNYGLKIVDEIMKSETGLWINPELRKAGEKKELLDMFLLNLSGALNAENKVLLLFNVENKNAPSLEKFIADNKLFADEPTRNTGDHYTEYSLQVNTMDKANPIPRIRYELAKRGALSIDTIPLISSIQSAVL